MPDPFFYGGCITEKFGSLAFECFLFARKLLHSSTYFQNFCYEAFELVILKFITDLSPLDFV